MQNNCTAHCFPSKTHYFSVICQVFFKTYTQKNTVGHIFYEYLDEQLVQKSILLQSNIRVPGRPHQWWKDIVAKNLFELGQDSSRPEWRTITNIVVQQEVNIQTYIRTTLYVIEITVSTSFACKCFF